MSGIDNHKVCPSCEQELAHTAYSRHLNEKTGIICPGKGDTSHTTSREASRSPVVSELNSTFNFGSLADSPVSEDGIFSCREDDKSDSLMSDTDSDDTASSDGEVWSASESEEEDIEQENLNNSVSEIVLGISFFLTLYHLLYRLSEHAIKTLLGFIRLLLQFLASVTGTDLLLRVANALPKSMCTVRKAFKKDNIL